MMNLTSIPLIQWQAQTPRKLSRKEKAWAQQPAKPPIGFLADPTGYMLEEFFGKMPTRFHDIPSELSATDTTKLQDKNFDFHGLCRFDNRLYGFRSKGQPENLSVYELWTIPRKDWDGYREVSTYTLGSHPKFTYHIVGDADVEEKIPLPKDVEHAQRVGQKIYNAIKDQGTPIS